MYPHTPDYSMHVSAYLHAWRQFLEQWTATTGGVPFPTAPSAWPTMPYMPPTVSFMPPMPPMPPFMPPSTPPAVPPGPTAPAPPADYTQQLLSYLQAWRQYLEQVTGARPGSPQAPPAQQPATQQPTADNPPANNASGTTAPASEGSEGNSGWPPPLVGVPPQNPLSSEMVATNLGQAPPLENLPPTSGDFVSQYRRPDPMQLLNPPEYAFGYRDRSSADPAPAATVVYTAQPETAGDSSAAVHLPAASPFSAMMERVEPGAAPQVAPESLFSTASTQVGAAGIQEAGHSPSS